jgi:hypothetical protein
MLREVQMRVVVVSIFIGRGPQTNTIQENYRRFTKHFRETALRSTTIQHEQYTHLI